MVRLYTGMMPNGMRLPCLNRWNQALRVVLRAEHSFYVTYEDEANQAPTSVKLYLDDKIYNMMPVEPKGHLFAKGVTYTAKVGALAWGPTSIGSRHLMAHTKSSTQWGTRPERPRR